MLDNLALFFSLKLLTCCLSKKLRSYELKLLTTVHNFSLPHKYPDIKKMLSIIIYLLLAFNISAQEITNVKKDTVEYPDEKEATFKGGQKARKKYLTPNLDANVGINLIAGEKKYW